MDNCDRSFTHADIGLGHARLALGYVHHGMDRWPDRVIFLLVGVLFLIFTDGRSLSQPKQDRQEEPHFSHCSQKHPW